MVQGSDKKKKRMRWPFHRKPIFHFSHEERTELTYSSDHPIKLGHLTFVNVECAFNACQYLDPLHREVIRRSGLKSTETARTLKNHQRKDWIDGNVSVYVMRALNEIKVLQHSDVSAQLMTTGKGKLVYDGADLFWAARDEQVPGRNELGHVWERIRDRTNTDESTRGMLIIMETLFSDRM